MARTAAKLLTFSSRPDGHYATRVKSHRCYSTFCGTSLFGACFDSSARRRGAGRGAGSSSGRPTRRGAGLWPPVDSAPASSGMGPAKPSTRPRNRLQHKPRHDHTVAASSGSAGRSVLWFRRDLRLADHPALLAAAAGSGVLGLFVADDALLAPSGSSRRAFLSGCLAALNEAMDGRLLVLHGRPEDGAAPRGPGRRRDGSPRFRRLHALRPGPGRCGREGPGRRRCGLRRDRLAVRGGAGPGAQGRRVPVRGLHPLLQRVEGARLAQARRGRRRGAVDQRW